MKVIVRKPSDMQIALAIITADAKEHGVSFSGNEQSGNATYRGGIAEGSYNVYSDRIEIVVHKKPFIISDNKAQREIRNYYAELEQRIEQHIIWRC